MSHRPDMLFIDRKLRVSRAAPKLRCPAMTPDRAAATFDRRRRRLLEWTAEPDATAADVARTSEDLHGNRAIANLCLGRYVEQADARIRYAAEWFDHPAPAGKVIQGPCTFVAQKLARAWFYFDGRDELSQTTRQTIRRFFLTHEFESYFRSENHALLFHTARYLMAQVFDREVWKGYGHRGRTLVKIDGRWLKRFIRYRAACGWGEFDSLNYIQPDWDCLLSLYDYAEDREMRRLAGQMLDLRLAEMAVETLNGLQCGAHGRIYSCDALDHAETRAYALQYLYFGHVDPRSVSHRTIPVDSLLSGYRPDPLVLEIAFGRSQPYEVRKRVHLHNTYDLLPSRPMKRSIRKYTLWTPHYVLGTVQKQDPYPPRCRGRHYAHHEQHQWDLTIGTRSRAKIFTHHPGDHPHEHGHWTGDLRCGCGHFFQHRTAVVALYDIPADQHYALIHAHLPREAFDRVLDQDGWVFVREGKVCAALKMLGGHKWTRRGPWKDMEIVSPGRRNGAICEVGLTADFGGFAAFRKEILANTVAFDAERMRLTYTSRRAGTLEIDTRGTRRIDGKAADLDYPNIDCPYLRSDWGQPLATLRLGRRRRRLDLRE